ncbi:MAG: hypothetical protein HN742_26140 [Lentisphaerae bacterium]|nr:hypothetical protein [Lentisphaerota bacterium]MBT4817218.1 hypothetical protein [Lentisphaerota bacterium]MBT5605555.1 hypothetical protein [Lentisphaerota bacterium]MBT7056832.1 hypothetical protein [Lentisphaerota bacterium]MBT7845382.1 hypothetical protein [Lentisphaerota bacterium]
MSDHPETVELELYRTGEADVDVCQHVAACAVCQEQVARLDSLAGSLNDLPASDPALFADVDRAVLAAIAGTSERRSPFLVLVRRRLIPAAAAALVLLGTFWVLNPRTGPAPVANAPGRAEPDVNGDGRLDILDALAMAQAVERGRRLAPAWDLNDDGRVDTKDANTLAQRVVSVSGGGTEG